MYIYLIIYDMIIIIIRINILVLIGFIIVLMFWLVFFDFNFIKSKLLYIEKKGI